MNKLPSLHFFALWIVLLFCGSQDQMEASDETLPNIIFVMADDLGWGQTSYNGHPDIKTPHLDAMAANGLRFDRFYAGASTCSPTRATVLTGRTNERTGVESHGFPLRLQEKTIAQALRDAGYATGHFGKWHLNGLRGPGAPILKSDTHNPTAFGFDDWLSVTNFFDRDPIMSRNGVFEEFIGDSSEIIVAEALKFIEKKAADKKPSFTVIWYGTPHSPMVASEEDMTDFKKLPSLHQNQYGEILAMDRSIGNLRKTLRDLSIADNTLVWFCSDNGGLKGFGPHTVGGLRGWKNTMFEGGLRVPAIVEWPAVIKESRITRFPAGTVDMFPTIAEIVSLPDSAMIQPQDGISLRSLFDAEMGKRKTPLRFWHSNRGVMIDNDYKIIAQNNSLELYNLATDRAETTDLFAKQPAIAEKMKTEWIAWSKTVEASVAGKDYPEGKVNPGEPEPQFWWETEAYRPFLSQLKDRPEYARINKLRKKKKK